MAQKYKYFAKVYDRMTRLLSEEGFNMSELDISEEMLDVARRNNKKNSIKYISGDMRNFHINEKQDAIKQMYTMHLHLINLIKIARGYI